MHFCLPPSSFVTAYATLVAGSQPRRARMFGSATGFATRSQGARSKSLHLLRLLGLAAILFAPGAAWAVNINNVTCAPGSNALRLVCTVETNVPAFSVKVRTCDATVNGTGCTKDFDSPADFTGNYRSSGCAVGTTCFDYDLTTWNHITGNTIEYDAVATGSPGATSATANTAAGALPAGLAAVDVAVSGTSDSDYFGFNYGCSASAATFGDYAIVTNAAGEVVWYEDPRGVSGGSRNTITGIKFLAHEVLTIIDHEWVANFHWNGTVIGQLSRAAGDFEDADMIDRYVHHDLTRDGSGNMYVVTARDHTLDDTLADCDGNAGTTTLDYVLDGVMKFDSSWALVDEWSLADIYDPTTCELGYSAPSSYWSGELGGSDWAHMNSIQLDGGGDWLLSLKEPGWVIYVDSSTGALDWELYGDNTSSGLGDWNIVASPTVAVDDFNGQHHARWTNTGTIMLFDNHNDDSINTSYSRGIEIELDAGTGEFDIIAEYNTGEDCPVTGSAVEVSAGGNVVTTCSDNGALGYDLIQEFAGSGTTPVYDMQLSCTAGMNYGRLYRARPLTSLSP